MMGLSSLLPYGIAAALVAGGIWYVYNEGGKNCRESYEYKILQTELANKEKLVAYYKNAKSVAKNIADDEAKRAEVTSKMVADLQAEISKLNNDNVDIIEPDFLRKLESIGTTP